MRTTKKCAFCGKEFFASEATKVERVPRSGMQKYCCEECQAKAKEARKKKQQDFRVILQLSGNDEKVITVTPW